MIINNKCSYYFGGHVEIRAVVGQSDFSGAAAVPKVLGESKISDFDLVVMHTEQNVPGSKIAVHHILVVHVSAPRNKLVEIINVVNFILQF